MKDKELSKKEIVMAILGLLFIFIAITYADVISWAFWFDRVSGAFQKMPTLYRGVWISNTILWLLFNIVLLMSNIFSSLFLYKSIKGLIITTLETEKPITRAAMEESKTFHGIRKKQ